MSEKFFFSRHTDRADDPKTGKQDKPEATEYKGITEPGVERAREQTKEIVKMIDESSPDAVVFIGGSSEEPRTKSTADVYGNTLDQHYQDDQNVIVVSQKTIDSLRDKDPNFKLGTYTQNIITDNPDKKIVISSPLYLKQLSLRPHFRDTETGQQSEYSGELYQAGHGDEEKATKALMQASKTDKPPTTPQQLAEQHLEGISRLRKFTKRFADDREVTVGLVGHGWNLDALSSYLADEGKAGDAGYQKTGDKMMEPSEIGQVTIDEDEARFTYRGQTYHVPPELLQSKS
jgi:hypothetical protein